MAYQTWRWAKAQQIPHPFWVLPLGCGHLTSMGQQHVLLAGHERAKG